MVQARDKLGWQSHSVTVSWQKNYAKHNLPVVKENMKQHRDIHLRRWLNLTPAMVEWPLKNWLLSKDSGMYLLGNTDKNKKNTHEKLTESTVVLPTEL